MAELTREEVSKHNSDGDTWIIVDGDVYDVSKFATLHPGGKQLLLDYAGQDATEEFFGLHRVEVLAKYKRLVKGRVKDAGPKKVQDAFGEISKVPYAEASYEQGMHSPYFKDSHKAFRKALRQFFADEVMEEAQECEKTNDPPSKEMRLRFGELGLIASAQSPGPHLKMLPNGIMNGVVSAEEFDYFHEMIQMEEMARLYTPGFEDGLSGGNNIATPVIIKFGTDKMKQEVLPKILKGEEVAALAISEAFAGSDVGGLRTRAEEGPSGDYIVKGTKKWITSGMYADWFVTAVRTGGNGAGGVSMMLVPRTEQVKTTLIKSKYSSSAGTCFISFDGAKAPKENIFGKKDKGFQIIMSNFNHERWMICVGCIARARVCVEESFKWAMQRKVFGKALMEQPVIREKMAQMFSGLESCTSMMHELTHNMVIMGPMGADIGGRIALLKYTTTRMMHMVGDNSVQIAGGRGVSQGGMGRIIEMFHRTYKIPSVYGGSEEIMADLAVRQAMKGYPSMARL
jgi:alkylation response protein AidB-like acyl-CoA dehydrogenase/predicted heme/steroid binding protein